ncbi:MAG: exodeoxyribonuclease VII small subunit [Gammaproteobacteria bacterium]|nr:MAG: exodeoxyribonuclease VII small subunit [Gammaproteobacteria bacterium]
MPAKKKAKAATSSTPDFEKSLKELEDLVEAMESGKLTLEESMEHFERGIRLTRICQQSLAQAEQKVKVLMEQSGTDKLVDFKNED